MATTVSVSCPRVVALRNRAWRQWNNAAWPWTRVFFRKPCTRGTVDPRRLGLLSGRRGRASGSRTPCFPTSADRRWPARGLAAASRATRSIGDGRHPATSRGAAFASAATPGFNRRRRPSPARQCRGRRGGTRASLRADGWEPT